MSDGVIAAPDHGQAAVFGVVSRGVNMRYRFLFFIAVMVLCLGGVAHAATPPTFLPEVLLMKSAHDGGEQWFEYAKLSPAVTKGAKPTVVFRYRADVDVVTCTIEAEASDATGAVIVKDGTVSDWLSTACSVLPEKEALRLARRVGAALLITEVVNDKLVEKSTADFKSHFEN